MPLTRPSFAGRSRLRPLALGAALAAFLASPAAAADLSPDDGGWLPDLTLRLTQGGLSAAGQPDAQSLGGGQLALDVRLGSSPLWVSWAGEYYKQQPEAQNPWEIDDLGALYLLYRTEPIPRIDSELVFGVGVGRLNTGGDEEAAEYQTASHQAPVYQVTAAANRKLYKRLGLWVDVRYLYSRKTEGEVRVVDFSSRGLLVGFTYNTGW